MKIIQRKKEHDVIQYEFEDFSVSDSLKNKKSNQESQNIIKNQAYEKFSFEEMNSKKNQDKKELGPVLKKEREHEKTSLFNISPIVREFRGIREQEKEDFELKVRQEVEYQASLMRKEWMEEGFKVGKKEALEKEEEAFKQKYSLLVDQLVQDLDRVSRNSIDVCHQQAHDIILMIKTVVRWIILKELSNDGEYIKKLLEKLCLEMGQKENLLIKVSPTYFQEMPEVLEYIYTKIGELKNVRVEKNYEEKSKGIIVESSLGLLDGTIETQLKTLDDVFKDIIL